MARKTSLLTKKTSQRLGKKKYPSYRSWCPQSWQLGIALVLGISNAIAFESCTFAQIVPDNTLGNESSTPAVNANVAGTFQINGGATRGTNLFHSFDQFNVNQGQLVYFTNPAGIQNILSRVTGSNVSNILGTLGVGTPGAVGTANLFLINPNGIVFGKDAKLDVGGSFVGTTANAIKLSDGSFFSATNPQPVPLLTINVPFGLQFGSNPKPITVQGYGLQGVSQGFGLKVPPGKTLALLGGNVTLDGGILQAPGGRIELASIAAEGTVSLDINNLSASSPDKVNLKAFTIPDGLERGDIKIANDAVLDVIGNGGGDITLTAQNIDISGSDTKVCAGIGQSGSSCNSPGSDLGSSTSQAGNIFFDGTGTVTIKQSRIENNLNPGATGNSGDIFDAIINRGNIFGSILIEGDSISVTDSAEVSTSSFGTGSAGVVLLTTKGAISVENSGIFSSMNSTEKGNAGGIWFEGGSISLNNSQMRVQSSSTQGKAGIIFLEAEGGAISINNSVIFTSVRSGAVGNARGVAITGRSVSLTDSRVTSNMFGTGDAGAVIFTVDDSLKLVRSYIFSNVESGGVGQGGAIKVNARTLSLFNGSQLQTIVRGADGDTPAGVGNAGGIGIFVREAEITGVNDNPTSINFGKPSLITSSSSGQGDAGLVILFADRDVVVGGNGNAISSEVFPGGVGDAGGIGIRARTLYIRDGARVSVSNYNRQSGNAGAIVVLARDIRLENQGFISAVTYSGKGGDIILKADDLLVLTKQSDISTTAGFAPGGGDGGNVTIQAKFIVAASVNDSNITAQAYQGSGGNIDIDSSKLYEIDRNSDDFLNTNDITASSRYGRNGEVRTNVLDVDPTQGLTNPPTDLVDPSQLIAQRCAARSRTTGQENKFTIPGRGGLPSNPNDILQNDSVITNWVTLDPKVENPTGKQTSAQPQDLAPVATNAPQTKAYTEAQGWVLNEQGEVILTAQSPTVTSDNPSLTPTTFCNAS